MLLLVLGLLILLLHVAFIGIIDFLLLVLTVTVGKVEVFFLQVIQCLLAFVDFLGFAIHQLDECLLGISLVDGSELSCGFVIEQFHALHEGIAPVLVHLGHGEENALVFIFLFAGG